MEKNKIGILTFEKMRGAKEIGSSRIRGHWLVENWEEAEIFKYGKEYDVVIYQKAYFVEHAELFKGIKIFDICDPDYLHYGYRTAEMLANVDAVTTSTQELAEDFKKFTDKPVVFIPDRQDISKLSNIKIHRGEAKIACWFGYSSNYTMLDQVVPFLVKEGYSLIVIADKPYTPVNNFVNRIEIINYPWNDKTAFDDIVKADVLVNPQSSKGKWKYKSNNKSITANLLNIPVAQDAKDLARLKNLFYRRARAEKERQFAIDNYDIKLSVADFKNLITRIQNEKTK